MLIKNKKVLIKKSYEKRICKTTGQFNRLSLTVIEWHRINPIAEMLDDFVKALYLDKNKCEILCDWDTEINGIGYPTK